MRYKDSVSLNKHEQEVHRVRMIELQNHYACDKSTVYKDLVRERYELLFGKLTARNNDKTACKV
tara:strand:- start:591 stop:782 length:192 start_codon:yes stop_codon:yes gene_type:complete